MLSLWFYFHYQIQLNLQNPIIPAKLIYPLEWKFIMIKKSHPESLIHLLLMKG